jgi:hypothetical protein
MLALLERKESLASATKNWTKYATSALEQGDPKRMFRLKGYAVMPAKKMKIRLQTTGINLASAAIYPKLESTKRWRVLLRKMELGVILKIICSCFVRAPARLALQLEHVLTLPRRQRSEHRPFGRSAGAKWR